ncbi:MAG: fused MFS/spermidine synthase [Bacteroidales bacterium]
MTDTNKRAIFTACITLGFTGLTTQLILLREFLSVLNGNELVVGVILTNWMLLTGAGAIASRLFHLRDRGPSRASFLIALLAIFPIAAIVSVYVIRQQYFPPGLMLSPLQIWVFSLVVLAPFCISSGLLFPFLSENARHTGMSNAAGKMYGIEGAGSLAGGLLTSFLFVFYLSSVQTALILFLANILIISYILSLTHKKWKAVLFSIPGLILFSWFFFSGGQMQLRQRIFPAQDLLQSSETPYGKIDITSTAGQINFYENANLLFSESEKQGAEELVHFTLSQHTDPQQILLISGGISGTVAEILKYPDAERIDYVEINPVLITEALKYKKELQDPRVHIFREDGRLFLRQGNRAYDIIIADLPDPLNAQLNRFYTREFFTGIKERLTADGVFSFHLSSSGNYMSEKTQLLHGTIYNTLDNTFEHLLILPGQQDYYLASQSSLHVAITDSLISRGIQTVYVNAGYIDDALLDMRSSLLRETLESGNVSGINTDFRPIAYYLQIAIWLSHFRTGPYAFILIPVILSLLALFISNRVNRALFVTGFTGASLEFMIIIAFQVIFGFIYYFSAILITFFMAGIALGATILSPRITVSKSNYLRYQSALVVLSLLLPVTLYLVNRWNAGITLSSILFVLLAIAAGILTGIQFSNASGLAKIPGIRSVSSAYSIDLLGSAAGSLISAMILVPMLGIWWSCMLLAGLNILAILHVWLSRKEFVLLG